MPLAPDPIRGRWRMEQSARAERLARLGLAQVLEEKHISAQSMADAIKAALALPEPDKIHLDLDGAAGTARALHRLYDER